MVPSAEFDVEEPHHQYYCQNLIICTPSGNLTHPLKCFSCCSCNAYHTNIILAFFVLFLFFFTSLWFLILEGSKLAIVVWCYLLFNFPSDRVLGSIQNVVFWEVTQSTRRRCLFSKLINLFVKGIACKSWQKLKINQLDEQYLCQYSILLYITNKCTFKTDNIKYLKKCIKWKEEPVTRWLLRWNINKSRNRKTFCFFFYKLLQYYTFLSEFVFTNISSGKVVYDITKRCDTLNGIHNNKKCCVIEHFK